MGPNLRELFEDNQEDLGRIRIECSVGKELFLLDGDKGGDQEVLPRSIYRVIGSQTTCLGEKVCGW